MKIKYKITLSLVPVIIAASLPVTIFMIDSHEKEKIGLIVHQGSIQSGILAYSAMNILIMNSGDIAASRLDARAMIQIMAPLVKDGMVYSGAVIISSRAEYHGIVLADFTDPSSPEAGIFSTRRLSGDETRLLMMNMGGRETVIGGKEFYQCVNTATLPDGKPISLGRVVFSKSRVLEPIMRLRRISYGATGIAILGSVIIGLVFSRYLSRPIDDLTESVSRIEFGGAGPVMPVVTRDETGKLATTFNHLITMINLEISELLKANKDLVRLDKVKDEFLANISHELMTPLTGIIGLAESLREGIAGDQAVGSSHILDLIMLSGRRLSVLVDDILDYSRLRNRDIELAMKPVSVMSLTGIVLALLGPLIEKKGLAVTVRVEPENLAVAGDENRLQQVMFNVLGNAVKFTEKGGIDISAGLKEGDGRSVVITVRDSGIGIAPENLGRIFGSFEQGDASTSRTYGGAGLGLSIAKKLVELHGGEIGAESVHGEGSMFTITLKAAGEAVPGGGGKALALKAPLPAERVMTFAASGERRGEWKDMNILVVDDDQVNLQVIYNFLVMEGYSVEPVESGAAALNLLEGGARPDLVLLDVMLPVMDGYETCRKIRERFPVHELPVVMLTARGRAHDIVAGFRSGASDYLSKPINRDELMARIANLLKIRDSVRQAGELSVIKRDMAIAHRIHRSAILRDAPAMENASITVRYLPMMNLGGDFYDIIGMEDGKFGVVVADVSGHGISAAIICAMLKMAFTFHAGKGGDPAAILAAVSRSVSPYLEGMFITACYVFFDPGRGVMTYSCAGHWPPLLVRRGGAVEGLEAGEGMPLGLDENPVYGTESAALENGDRVILYTDGIIEVRNGEGRMMGPEAFRDLVRGMGGLDSRDLADGIIGSVTAWKGKEGEAGLDDDVTLMVLDIGRS